MLAAACTPKADADEQLDQMMQQMGQIKPAQLPSANKIREQIAVSPAASGTAAAPPAQGNIVISIDPSSLDQGGASNYVQFRNIGQGSAQLTAWTANCSNVEVARCGTILSNVSVPAGGKAGFWINRDDDSQAWSYTTGCNVSPGTLSSCVASGGGGAAPPASTFDPSQDTSNSTSN